MSLSRNYSHVSLSCEELPNIIENFLRFLVVSRVIFLKFTSNHVLCYKPFHSNFRLKPSSLEESTFSTPIASSLVNTFVFKNSNPALADYLWLHVFSLCKFATSLCLFKMYLLCLASTKPSRFRCPVWEAFFDSRTVFPLVFFHLA